LKAIEQPLDQCEEYIDIDADFMYM